MIKSKKPTSYPDTGPYRVYSAGGLFNLHEVAVNVLIKEAVWELSEGRFQLMLPQSKEMRESNQADLPITIRNGDLLSTASADIILARFDGPELDSGTVVEFMIAKFLGKPTVLLRSDARGLGRESLDSPYNLMARNWSRTVEVHIDALIRYRLGYTEASQEYGGGSLFEAGLAAERMTIEDGIQKLAGDIIAGFKAVLALESPYPPAYQEEVYKIFRHSPGGGFDQVLSETILAEIIERLRQNRTL